MYARDAAADGYITPVYGPGDACTGMEDENVVDSEEDVGGPPPSSTPHSVSPPPAHDDDEGIPAGAEESKAPDVSPTDVLRLAGSTLDINLDLKTQFRGQYSKTHTLNNAVADKLPRDKRALCGLASYSVAALRDNLARDVDDPLVWPPPLHVRKTVTVKSKSRGKTPTLRTMAELKAYAIKWVQLLAQPDETSDRLWSICNWCVATWAVFREVGHGVTPASQLVAAACVDALSRVAADAWPTVLQNALREAAVAQRRALGSIQRPDAPTKPNDDMATAAGVAWGKFLSVIAARELMEGAGLWSTMGESGIAAIWEYGRIVAAPGSVLFDPPITAAEALSISWEHSDVGFVLPPGELSPVEVDRFAVADDTAVRNLVLGTWASRARFVRGTGRLLETAFMELPEDVVHEDKHTVASMMCIGAAAIAIPGGDGTSPYFKGVVQWACGFAPARPPVVKPPMVRLQRALASAIRGGAVPAGDEGVGAVLEVLYPGKFADLAELWGAAQEEAGRRSTADNSAAVWLFGPKTTPSTAAPPTVHVASEPGEDGSRAFLTPAFLPVAGSHIWVRDTVTKTSAQFVVASFSTTTAVGIWEGMLFDDAGAFRGLCTADVVAVSAHDASRGEFPAMTPGVTGSVPFDLFGGKTACMLRVYFGGEEE